MGRRPRDWASEHFISVNAMSSIHSVRAQLLHELNRIGFVANNDIVRTRDKKKLLREDASVNQNAGNNLLCTAVWATGLPGNISVRRSRLSNFGTFRTCMEEHAGLHPSSVAFHRKPPKYKVDLPRWFLYSEMVLSSQVFLRCCTALKPEQVLLFGGYSLSSPNGNSYQDTVRIVLDDWIVVEGSCEDTIHLLSCARREVNAALDMKVMKPRSPLPDVSQSIIDAVCIILDDLDDNEVES